MKAILTFTLVSVAFTGAVFGQQPIDLKEIIARSQESQDDPGAMEKMRNEFQALALESQRRAAEAPTREALEGYEKTIARTIELLFSGATSAEECLEAMGEIAPDQASAINELIKNYRADIEKIDKIGPELEGEYVRSQGREPRPGEIESMIRRTKALRQKQFRTDLERELFEHQRVAISQWNPERTGLRFSLTETPVGDALGLTEKQKEEIRKRSQEIGSRFREAWYQAQRDSLELYEDTLTDEQVAKLKEVFDRNTGERIPFVPSQPDEILFQMPYEFYAPDDLEARKKYGSKD